MLHFEFLYKDKVHKIKTILTEGPLGPGNPILPGWPLGPVGPGGPVRPS